MYYVPLTVFPKSQHNLKPHVMGSWLRIENVENAHKHHREHTCVMSVYTQSNNTLSRKIGENYTGKFSITVTLFSARIQTHAVCAHMVFIVLFSRIYDSSHLYPHMTINERGRLARHNLYKQQRLAHA